MGPFTGMTPLELAEYFAECEGLICSEEDASQRFDEEVLPGVIEMYGEDDTIAINLAFGEWMDCLRDDGYIHITQYNEYDYVGRCSSE